MSCNAHITYGVSYRYRS